MKIFKNTDIPKESKDKKGRLEGFSVDVISCDVDGMMNLCYWDYEKERWSFLADALSDPYEGGKLIDFVWMYKPDELSLGIADQLEKQNENVKKLEE